MKKTHVIFLIISQLLFIGIVIVLLQPAPQSVRNDIAQVAYQQQEDGSVYEMNPDERLRVICPNPIVLDWRAWFRNRTEVLMDCRPDVIAFTPTPITNPTTSLTLSPTGIPQSTATVTATLPAGATPTRTNTPAQPTATRTPSGASIPPFKGAQACTDHDPYLWHALWNPQLGCHYDHTHGDDPALADSYFGPLGAFWNGTTISYPFPSSSMENTHKHGGYKVYVRQPDYHPLPRCGTQDNTDSTGENGHTPNCIVAVRLEIHNVGGSMDTLARYHSYWLEVYVCKGHPNPAPAPNSPTCGTFSTGGLLDFGELKVPHYNGRVVRDGQMGVDFMGIMMDFPADEPDLPARSGEPYVFSEPASDIEQYRRNSPRGSISPNDPKAFKATIDQWSSNDFDCEFKTGASCHNQYTHVLTQVGDPFNLIDVNDPYNIVWICYPEPGCEYDGSMIGLNEVAVRILQAWQNGGNGYVTFSGFSDKWGNPLAGCTEVSADCIPFVLNHAPVGDAASRSDNLCECQVYDYDSYFDGKPSGWIKFAN